MMAEQEAGVSNPSEVGQEVPASQPQARRREGLQLDGLDAQQEKIGHVGGERRSHSVMMQLFLKGNMEIW